MQITPAMVQEWFDCPKRFWFRHVEGEVRPPLLQPVWENAVLSGLISCMMAKEKEDRLMELDEMIGVVINQYTSQLDLLERVPRKGKMDSYFAHATTICQEFLTRDMAVITPDKVATMHTCDIVNEGDEDHKLSALVHVLDGSQIGMIAVSQYKIRERIAETSPLLVYAAMASGIDHYWFLTISVRKGANFTKYHGYVPEGRKRWFTKIITELAPLMENGPYPPCNPGVWHCHPRFCQFWGSCRGTSDVKGRVTRS